MCHIFQNHNFQMVKLSILGPTFKNTLAITRSYKGLMRFTLPTLPVNEIKRRKINEAYGIYLENIDANLKDGEYLSNYQLAQKIADTYTQCNENEEVFRVVEVIYPSENPQFCKNFLGYDVVISNEGKESVIINYFSFHKDLGLLKRNELNDNFLFKDLDSANNFLSKYRKILDEAFTYEAIGLYS